jgi:hypothetical protein
MREYDARQSMKRDLSNALNLGRDGEEPNRLGRQGWAKARSGKDWRI